MFHAPLAMVFRTNTTKDNAGGRLCHTPRQHSPPLQHMAQTRVTEEGGERDHMSVIQQDASE